MISSFWRAFKNWANTDPEFEEISALYKMKWVMQHPDYELSDDGEVIKKSTGDTDMHNKVTEQGNVNELGTGSIVKVYSWEGDYKKCVYIGIISEVGVYTHVYGNCSEITENHVGITDLATGKVLTYSSATSIPKLLELMVRDGKTVDLANKPITID